MYDEEEKDEETSMADEIDWRNAIIYKEILDKNNVSNASILQGSIIELTHISDIILSTLSTSSIFI